VRFAAESWLFLLFGLPLLLGLLRVSDRRARHRLRALLGERATDHIEEDNPRLRQWRRFLLLVGIFWLVIALARPQWGAHEVVVKEKGTDIVVALDISNSMMAEDLAPNRLERAKAELANFLSGIPRGRVGLVLFAGSAFVQCPLTMDYGTAQIFLRMAAPDMISEQGTAIAAALATARQLLSGGGGRGGDTFEAIVLVTDGEDLEGEWEQEVQKCRDDGVVILPVGVGQETGGLIPVTDAQGRAAGFMKDEEGNVVMTRLDLAALERMAVISGGTLFRIGAEGLAGERLHDALGRLGERELEERRISAFEERFIWPLSLALLSLWIRLLLRPRNRKANASSHRRPAVGLGLFLVSQQVLVLQLLLLANSPALALDVLRFPGAADAANGRELFTQEKYEEALQAFETARALNPDDPRLSLAVGETLYKLERYEDALREFQRSLVLSESVDLRAESLYNAGTSLLAQGDPAKAAEALLQSLRLDPDQVDALHNLEIAMNLLQQSNSSQQGDSTEDQQTSQQQPEDSSQPTGEGDQKQQRGQQGEDSAEERPQGQTTDQQAPQPQAEDGAPQEERPQAPEPPSGQEPEPEEQPAPAQPPPQQHTPPESQESDSRASEADPNQMTQDEALRLLRALDHDEEQLKRSVQKRLKGGKAKSGKRW